MRSALVTTWGMWGEAAGLSGVLLTSLGWSRLVELRYHEGLGTQRVARCSWG
jgi:hypothetical protein